MLLPERNGAKMECIYHKHMDIHNTDFYFSATTKGRWGNIVDIFGVNSAQMK